MLAFIRVDSAPIWQPLEGSQLVAERFIVRGTSLSATGRSDVALPISHELGFDGKAVLLVRIIGFLLDTILGALDTLFGGINQHASLGQFIK